ncbi:MAG: hypothetical protein D6710_03125 [Nitrospirae bacterium]|nr:MAG: hypothetical protein D6710_03125 [Nitrospirota bacterium]
MKGKGIDKFALLYGKAPLIIFAVLICSVSFILGYYVGKSVERPGEVIAEKSSSLSEKKTEIAGIKDKEEAMPEKSPIPSERVDKEKETLPGSKQSRAKKQIVAKKTETLNEKPFPIQSKEINYYSIQVGAFSKRSDAERLKKRLSSKGYTVFINSSKGGKILYRVRVGRFIKRADAEKVALKLTINEKLKTFIVKVADKQ